ncbi:MAG: hypothetical protein WC997_11880 [Porticoccaceae bacterium]
MRHSISIKELVDSIVIALDDQIRPLIKEDKWAASTLRSVTLLLRHISVRVEEEPHVLGSDNIDSCQVLKTIRPLVADDVELERLIDEVLNLPVPFCDIVSVVSYNQRCQMVAERLLQYCAAMRGTAGGDTIRRELRAYLRRRLDRESHLYFPLFTEPPF